VDGSCLPLVMFRVSGRPTRKLLLSNLTVFVGKGVLVWLLLSFFFVVLIVRLIDGLIVGAFIVG